MCDRCAVQKKFSNLFTCFRKDVLPAIISEWESLSKEEKNKMSTVNEFFCGRHYLGGLADKAEACCQVWAHYVVVTRKLDPWHMVAIPKGNQVFTG